MSKKSKNLLAILIWIIIWEISSRVVNLELLLPSPIQTMVALSFLASSSSFYLSIVLTIVRVLLGFIIGILIGLILAVLSYLSDNLKILFAPIIKVIHVVPVASFIVLLMVWVNNSIVPVITGLLIVIPIVYNNILAGLLNLDENLKLTAKLFNLSFKDRFKYLYLMELKGYLTSAVSASLGMAFKATIAAEVIAASKLSLGRGIRDSKLYLETPELFAYTITILLISLLVERIIQRFMEALNHD